MLSAQLCLMAKRSCERTGSGRSCRLGPQWPRRPDKRLASLGPDGPAHSTRIDRAPAWRVGRGGTSGRNRRGARSVRCRRSIPARRSARTECTIAWGGPPRSGCCPPCSRRPGPRRKDLPYGRREGRNYPLAGGANSMTLLMPPGRLPVAVDEVVIRREAVGDHRGGEAGPELVEAAEAGHGVGEVDHPSIDAADHDLVAGHERGVEGADVDSAARGPR